jgi:hypothetical protein
MDVFAFIDAALGHLPPLRIAASGFIIVLLDNAAADPDTALRVQQHDANTRPVGQGCEFFRRFRFAHERNMDQLRRDAKAAETGTN